MIWYIIAFIVLGAIIWWSEKPVCYGCGKKIYEKMHAAIGHPSNVSIHDNDECSRLAYEKIKKSYEFYER